MLALPKCILATQRVHFPKENVQQNKMYASNAFVTFCWCVAEHFPLENVMLCKNAFLHQMHFGIKCIFAKQTKMLESGKMLCFLLCKKQRLCVAKMHLMQKCIFATQSNAFDAKMLCFLLCKKQRCVHFVLLNIFLWKMLRKNAFDAKMHLMPKCIFAYIFQRKMFSCAKMHLMQKCI